jgi:hypothetical protein
MRRPSSAFTPLMSAWPLRSYTDQMPSLSRSAVARTVKSQAPWPSGVMMFGSCSCSGSSGRRCGGSRCSSQSGVACPFGQLVGARGLAALARGAAAARAVGAAHARAPGWGAARRRRAGRRGAGSGAAGARVGAVVGALLVEVGGDAVEHVGQAAHGLLGLVAAREGGQLADREHAEDAEDRQHDQQLEVREAPRRAEGVGGRRAWLRFLGKRILKFVYCGPWRKDPACPVRACRLIDYAPVRGGRPASSSLRRTTRRWAPKPRRKLSRAHHSPAASRRPIRGMRRARAIGTRTRTP